MADEIKIGWVYAPASRRDASAFKSSVTQLAKDFQGEMEAQFPGFDWKHEVVLRVTSGTAQTVIDPLELLGMGCNEKLKRGWDYAFVISDSELLARKRSFTIGVPSSALEAAVLSTAPLQENSDDPENLERRLLMVAKYFFGHLLGLTPHEPGAMKRPLEFGEVEIEDFDEADHASIQLRLLEASDTRLEERGKSSPLLMPLRTFFANPRGILSDVIGYRPWRQPFQLGGLTAAALVSMVFLFFGAESWELGFKTSLAVLTVGAISTIFGAASFLIHGQNLRELTRHETLSEQLARTEVVLFLTVLGGVVSLWFVLFMVSLIVTFLLPGEVIQNWTGVEVTLATAARFSCFAATLGTLAGALGGNLEEESSFKANLLFDEES